MRAGFPDIELSLQRRLRANAYIALRQTGSRTGPAVPRCLGRCRCVHAARGARIVFSGQIAVSVRRGVHHVDSETTQ